MKWLSPIICLLLCANVTVFAQNIHQCASDKIHQELLDTSPDYVQKRALIEKTYRDAIKYVEEHGALPEATYTIPVVFHIMHNPGDAVGAGTNISLARIQTEIDNWNDAFDNVGAYAGGPFYSNSGIASSSVDINFCLATQDPLGFPTDGVTRFPFEHGSPLYRDDAGNDTGTELDRDMQSLIGWNTQDYFNVWVVDQICSSSLTPADCGVAGYAYFPGGFGAFYDGSVIQDDYIGVSTDLSKIMVHEAGHFLNLQHTFKNGCGSGDCLTGGDFVCDTPPDNSTSAVSCNSMNTANSCSTDATETNSPFVSDVQDIYENYMDYGFQSCQNTFTPNQATRMEAVLMPGGGRTELTTSVGCAAPSIATPQVAFAMDARTSYEGTTNGSGTCEGYRDIEVMLKISQAPAGSTTLNLNTAGTATAGRDYDLMTSSVTFSSGGDLYDFVTLRIYNDALVEGNETIILTYSIPGGGISTAASNQTMTITIKDDDTTPGLLVFSEDFENGQNGWTYSSFGGFTNRFRVGGNAGMTGSGAAYITDDLSTLAYSYDNTASDNALIYTPLIDGTSASNSTMSFSYKANGSGDDIGRIIYRQGSSGSFFVLGNSYTNNGSSVNVESFTLPSSLNGQSYQVGFYWDNSNGNGVGANPPFAIDNVSISVPGAPVESSTVSSSAYLGGNETVYFYAPDGELIAKIENTSSHDYGCTTVTVDRAGNGASSGAADYSTYDFTDKTITVTPTTNNATGTYKITVYYTETEIAGWEAAAGDVRANLSMIKTSGTIGSAQSANSVVEAPTPNGYGGDWAYEATFGSGFSGFGLGNVPSSLLPLELIKFDGEKQNETVALNWLTENEINTSHFEVERSVDSRIFKSIGNVAATGKAENAYNLMDYDPVEGVNYYRLKMVDLDGTTTYSQIVAITFKSDFTVLVRPNPIQNNEINLLINSVDDGEILMDLRDVRGVQLYNQNLWVEQGATDNILKLNDLPNGIYFLRIQKGNATKVIRVVNN